MAAQQVPGADAGYDQRNDYFFFNSARLRRGWLGTPPSMKRLRLCGWETRSMFDRYDIIDEHDLAEAVALRFGKHLANNEGVAPGTDSVTSSSINS